MTVSRRRLIGAAAAASVGMGMAPSVKMPLLLRPGSGVKIRGAILYNADWFGGWAPFWFNFQWNDVIKPMLDAAASIGANCIQVSMSGVGPEGGFNYPSDVVLQAELVQVCSYAASLGMATFLQFGTTPSQSFGADRSNLTAGTAAAAKIAGWADKIPSIVAIDTMNEWYLGVTNQPWAGNATQAVADMTSYMTAIRAATTKPLTISSGGFDTTSNGLIAGLVDFHTPHYYNYTNIGGFDPNVAAGIRAAGWYKGAFLLGETGKPLAGSDVNFTVADQKTWMTAAGVLAQSPDCLGSLHWTLVDSFPPTPGFWGTFPNPIAQNVTNPRPQMALPFRQWPGKL